jgi:ABC-type branched-subunit amino acid transport system substrate-binding protein
MCSTRRYGARFALLACLTVLAGGCGDDGAAPAPVTTAAAPPAPLRTLYVQAPLTGPAADEGRAMVDAVRLVVGQAHGLAGEVRVIVRTLDDGGTESATDPKRCAANARRAVADPRALAVIGTYELTCSKSSLAVLRPAGMLLVSPLNATDALPGALRLAPTTADQGTAAAQLAEALGATRVAIVSQRPGAAGAFATALASAAAGAGIDPVVDLDASATPVTVLMDELLAGRIQVVALAGSPGPWADELLRAIATLPKAQRPAVVAPQAFDTLAFLDEARGAAEGVRVLSRLVPAEQLGGEARDFAGAYADLHGQPPPVAIYAADAARAVLEAVAGTTASRAAVATALRALPVHDGLLGRWAATPAGGVSPRRLAVLIVAGGTFRTERVISVTEPLPPSGGVK